MCEDRKNKRISVIIPNYNKEKYIQRCIDSVLEQSYPEIEIVIVDDCSNDLSPEIIKTYQKKYSNITAILLKENRGVSHARNKGIEMATGYYVTMLDSDDFYYNSKKLENEITLLNKHNGEGIAYSYRQIVDDMGNLVNLAGNDQERYISGNIFYRLMTDKNACTYVQRDYVLPKNYVLGVGGYRENESYYEDFDLLLRLAAEHPMFYTGEDGTAYRLINNGLSTTQKENDAKQFKVPQKIRFRYISKFTVRMRFKVYVIWVLENCRLEVRILGRKVKRKIGSEKR